MPPLSSSSLWLIELMIASTGSSIVITLRRGLADAILRSTAYSVVVLPLPGGPDNKIAPSV